MNAIVNAASPEPTATSTQQKSGLEVRDDVVIDHTSGLMWTRNDVTDGRVTFAAFEQAVAKCSAGGFTDWQIPDRVELQTILDFARFDPSVNLDAFPTCKAAAYWTRTPCAWDSSYVWVVYFYGGLVYGYHRDNGYAFGRAVRRVAASQ